MKKRTGGMFGAMLLIVGCAAEDGPVGSEGAPKPSACAKTTCEAKQASDSGSCGRCTSACLSASYRCDPDRACRLSCAPTLCTDAERETCAEP